MTARYAIYFSPADDTELDIFGATVMRRRASSATEWFHPSLPVANKSETYWINQTKKPAHYGFHATIKAPFTLAEGESPEQLQSDLTKFCLSHKPIDLTGLSPVRLNPFYALAFDEQPQALRTLAAECVTQFEKYRAPLTEADVKRRDPSSLTKSQQANLNAYGYPYVLEDFNFHMTLSGANDPDETDYLNWLKHLYKSVVTQTPVLDRLSIFYQPDRDTAFVRLSEHGLNN